MTRHTEMHDFQKMRAEFGTDDGLPESGVETMGTMTRAIPYEISPGGIRLMLVFSFVAGITANFPETVTINLDVDGGERQVRLRFARDDADRWTISQSGDHLGRHAPRLRTLKPADLMRAILISAGIPTDHRPMAALKLYFDLLEESGSSQLATMVKNIPDHSVLAGLACAPYVGGSIRMFSSECGIRGLPLLEIDSADVLAFRRNAMCHEISEEMTSLLEYLDTPIAFHLATHDSYQHLWLAIRDGVATDTRFRGVPLLHKVVAKHDYDDVRDLHDIGVDMTAVDNIGSTALHVAMSREDTADLLRIVKLLVNTCGIDQMTRDHAGTSPRDVVEDRIRILKSAKGGAGTARTLAAVVRFLDTKLPKTQRTPVSTTTQTP